VLGVVKRWGFEAMDRLNVNGSGISLGHPIGATGVRIAVTLLHEMQRRKVRRGLETMCVGGGVRSGLTAFRAVLLQVESDGRVSRSLPCAQALP
jgi:acetyl-CoA acetyltransferase